MTRTAARVRVPRHRQPLAAVWHIFTAQFFLLNIERNQTPPLEKGVWHIIVPLL
ncbi:MAG: hypothetical protein Q7S86_02160 [bacterium]|nr:hypothetical protein [bacterium]